MKKMKGFTVPALLITVVLLAAALVVGLVILRPDLMTGSSNTENNAGGDAMKEDSGDVMEMKKDDAMMKQDGDAMEKKNDSMESGESMDAMKKEDASSLQFVGTKLSGTSSPLLDFNKADYDKAVASEKLVVLYFYANWCPICRAEFPKAEAAFGKLTGDQVVGFRVNFNDDQTDDNEKALAREYGVAYQHTKVFVRNGQRILKSPEAWEEERYLQEIEKAL